MEDFITFELAKKLKEKGFPQVEKNALAMYNEVGEWFSLAKTLDKDEYSFEDFDDRDCVCPTIAQVLKWLREEKKIHLCTELDANKNWYYTIEGIDSTYNYIDYFNYNSYEKASIAGIEYVLNNNLI